jgi:CRISPR-associated RAMP protein (TIGR02581 family)
MLKKMINYVKVQITIEPMDPILIKSSQATVGGVDMSFVRTYRHGGEPEPFLPGSSLKGVMRSYAEKICRSLRDDPVPVCLPYLDQANAQGGERGQAACGLRIRDFLNDSGREAIPTADIYRISCPACRMFGSHYFIGRLATSDAYLSDEYKKNVGKAVLETRDGVAIDRLTGGTVHGAKYDLEVLTRGEFFTQIELYNFERWQLGLLGLVLRDMCDGLVRIGMGKSRGLGRINANIERFEIAYFGNPQNNLAGISGCCTPDENKQYGFFPETDPGMPLPASVSNGLRHIYDITSDWQVRLEPAVNDLAEYVGQVPWPDELNGYIAGRN